MAKWTISEYSHLPAGANGAQLPVYSRPRATVGKTAAATVTLNPATKFVRFIGDTAAHVALGAAATTDDPYVAAGAEFVIGLDSRDATQLTFIAG
jgi:hypothetical protein